MLEELSRPGINGGKMRDIQHFRLGPYFRLNIFELGSDRQRMGKIVSEL